MNTTNINTNQCDKCNRQIPSHKGFKSIDGWSICGLCQYELKLKNNYIYFNEEWNTENK